MSDTLVLTRQFSSESHIPFRDIRVNSIGDKKDTILNTLETMSDYPIHIIDTNCGTLEKLIKTIKYHSETYNTDVFIVDYVQLLRSERGYKGNRTQEVGDISVTLKELATDLNACFILVTQYNRETAKDENIENRIRGARDSGQIEQDASFFGDISFKSYTSLKRKYEKLSSLTAPPYNYAVLSVLKWRHGEQGDFPLCYVPAYYKYTNGDFGAISSRGLFCATHTEQMLTQKSDGSYSCPECGYTIPAWCGKCTDGLTFYTITAENGFSYEFTKPCSDCGRGIIVIDRVKRMNSLINKESEKIPFLRYKSS
jgi:replicative DNA helicase